MRILLAAEESAGVYALREILESGHELSAVLTSATPGSKRGVVPGEVAARAGIAVWPAARVREPELADEIRGLGVDLLLNVHSLFLIHPEVVAAPRLGSFNVHPGPLPRYAGLNAPSWAIFNGESRHAVTLHWMEAGVDTGAIAYETWFDLTDDDTGRTASTRCIRESVPLVRRLLADAPGGEVPAKAQSTEGRRCYRRKEVPFEGRIDWSRGAGELVRFIRGADYHPMPSPWGIPRAALNGAPIGVVSARRTGRACDDAPGTVGEVGVAVSVAAGGEWIELTRVRHRGRVAAARDVLAPGMRLEPGPP